MHARVMQEWQSTRSQQSALAAVQAVALLHLLVLWVRLAVGAGRNEHTAVKEELETASFKSHGGSA